MPEDDGLNYDSAYITCTKLELVLDLKIFVC